MGICRLDAIYSRSRGHNDLYSTILSHVQHHSLLIIYLLTIRVLVNNFSMIIADLYATAFEGPYLVVTFPSVGFRAHVDFTTLGHIRILLTHIFF